MTANKRNLSVEYLRLFFMFLIVQLHIMQFGYGEEFIINDISTNSYIQLPLITIGKLGVPGFIFISGYYGIKLKWERLVSLWSQTTFYATLSAILSFIFFNFFSFKECIDIVVSLFYKWWFVEYYVFLMLISPMLNRGIELLSKRKFSLIVIIIIFYIYVVLWFNTRYSACSLLQFISIYIIGRYLALYPIKWLKDHCVSLCIISIFSLIVLTDIVHFLKYTSLLKYIITYYNILILIGVISLFMICNKYEFKGNSNFVLRNCLAIYLIHSTGFFYKVLMGNVCPKIPFNLLIVIAGIILIVFICSLMEEIRKTLFKGFEKKLIDRIEFLFIRKYRK